MHSLSSINLCHETKKAAVESIFSVFSFDKVRQQAALRFTPHLRIAIKVVVVDTSNPIVWKSNFTWEKNYYINCTIQQ